MKAERGSVIEQYLNYRKLLNNEIVICSEEVQRKMSRSCYWKKVQNYGYRKCDEGSG